MAVLPSTYFWQGIFLFLPFKTSLYFIKQFSLIKALHVARYSRFSFVFVSWNKYLATINGITEHIPELILAHFKTFSLTAFQQSITVSMPFATSSNDQRNMDSIFVWFYDWPVQVHFLHCDNPWANVTCRPFSLPGAYLQMVFNERLSFSTSGCSKVKCQCMILFFRNIQVKRLLNSPVLHPICLTG